MKQILLFFIAFFIVNTFSAQVFNAKSSLFGANNDNRNWWNVRFYELKVNFDIPNQSISGETKIVFEKVKEGEWMQIDLKKPLEITKITHAGKSLSFLKMEGYVVLKINEQLFSKKDSIVVFYQGKPMRAKNAPWDGGFVFTNDAKNRDLIGVACQGLGASSWWPCKDHVSDEPELGVKTIFTIPKELDCASNGRLLSITENGSQKTISHLVTSPINNYNVTFYIGHYVHLKDTYEGLKGTLDLEYVVLDYNKEKALAHLQKDTKDMLKAFEKWFGPYPFYNDGYKLVETNYLGMEHQSAIAYGNSYKKGYQGWDRSMSGTGKQWDYIVVHESGHEWWGNQVSCSDVADLWIHEGFTTYSEILFVEETQGKDAALKYLKGLRRNISNDSPIIGVYDQNQEGSGDMYDKGAQIVAMIRAMMKNDSLFRQMLIGIQKDLGLKTISTKEVEDYIIAYSKLDLTSFFDQYLRTDKVPVFTYSYSKSEGFVYWVENVNADFHMPIQVEINGVVYWLQLKSEKQKIKIRENFSSLRIGDAFYMKSLMKE